MGRPSEQRSRRRFQGSAATTLLLGILLLLNLPLYAGCSVTPFASWRMEHGRLGLSFHPELTQETTFYIAPNSEGLRWVPELAGHGGGFELQLPLWILVAAAGACTIVLHRRLD